METKPYTLTFIFVLNLFYGIAQDRVAKYPVRMSQYYNNYVLLNPALAGCTANYELSTGYQRLLGNFSKVSTYYFNANMRLSVSRRNDESFSVLGFRVFNDREGKYLNRTRGYIIYSWHANLTRKLKFSAGLELGGMNYSVKGTPLSGDGSDMKTDASAGVSIYNSNFNVGFSMQQLFKSEVQPLEEITVLYPFFNFTAQRRFQLNENILLIPSTSIRMLTNDKELAGDFNLGFVVRKNLFLSTGLYNNNKIAFAVGINDIGLLDGKVNIHVSYAYPLSQSVISYSIAELGLIYTL